MQEELRELQPELKETKIDTEKLLKEVEKEKKEVEKIKKVFWFFASYIFLKDVLENEPRIFEINFKTFVCSPYLI